MIPHRVLTLDGAIVFARLCPIKVKRLDPESLLELEQYIPSWAGVHAIMQLYTDIFMIK